MSDNLEFIKRLIELCLKYTYKYTDETYEKSWYEYILFVPCTIILFLIFTITLFVIFCEDLIYRMKGK